uniref:Diacylglycerol kinase n=1 Tax=Glossina brevipalpis TaxID=37001 RepID=A0A1A9WS31_9MUSC
MYCNSDICNFIIHERCVSNVVTPCSGIAPCIIKNPVAHCWSEPTHHRKKFCTVCRKRLDETPAVHCLVCDYFAHLECQDFAVPDCTENATYVPGKELLNVKHQHHWREGNLPSTSKCAYCKKTCWSSECLTGYRCEWCGITTHGGCRVYLPTECNFGVLQPIYLPPHSVSIPRTEVPIEAIIGVQVKSKSSLVRDYSCPTFNDYETRNPVTTAKTTPICLTNVNNNVVVEKSTASQLSLREHLLLERQRREQSKQNFFLSSSTAPSSSTTSLIYSTSTSSNKKSSTTNNANKERRRNLSQSSMISLQQKQTILSNSEDEDVGVLSGIDFSDDNEFYDIEFHERSRVSRHKERQTAGTSGIASDYSMEAASSSRDIGSDMDDESIFQRNFYEISQASGEIINNNEDVNINTKNLDITTNLNLNNNNNNKDNKDKKNTSIVDRNKKEHNLPLSVTLIERKSSDTSLRSAISSTISTALDVRHPFSRKINATTNLKTILTPPMKSYSSDYSLTSSTPQTTTTSSQPDKQQSSASINRNKLFRESRSSKLHSSMLEPRSKKYVRFFKRRRSKRSKNSLKTTKVNKSNYTSNTISQNIKIIIQDEHGNYHPYDDNYDSLSCGQRSYNQAATSDDGEDDEENDEDDDEDDENILRRYLDNRLKPLPPYHSVPQSIDLSDGGSSQSRSQPPNNNNNKHMFGRFLKRMRRFSIGWRRSRYHKRRARSISEEFSSGDTPCAKDEETSVTKIESVYVGGGVAGVSAGAISSSGAGVSSAAGCIFDGNNSFKRQLYRVIMVSRTYTLEQLLTTALRAFHITRDPSAFYLTDLYAPAGMEDAPLQDPNPVQSLIHLEGKRPAIYLRFHDKDKGHVRVYPGKLQCSLEDPYVSVPVDNTTTIKDLIRDALDKFVLLDRGVTERILSWNERPWDIMKHLGKDSIRQMELMRFYMQYKQDPHGPNIALFVGNLPPGLSQRNYEQILNRYVTDENKFTSIGPIYYEYGSVVLTFEDSQKAVRAFYNLRETIIEDKKLLVLLLPNIEPSMVPSDVRPLLVFVNVKSGGCQGLELISSFRKLLNPFQVFDLDNGGPLPGLYVFRQIANYKILVCGGDGTIGWVLQCLDNVGQDSECSSPPCAIVPLGTGNDLARVLCWGSGYTGGEDPLNLLRDVIDAEEIRLDRWTVVFHPEERPEEPAIKAPSNTTGKKKKAHQAHLSQQTNQHHQLPAITSSDISGGGGAQNEDNSQIFVMNNYFGIGVDADLCLDFHNAREENPNKFNSRLHNKGYYVKMGLRKIVGRKTVKELHKELRLEVDGKVIELPPVEGIIILNILSWGSGANPWGPDKDDNFTTPNHYDGVLEIVGVSGVVHLGQIQSGIRTATRIAQGGHIKIHLYSDMPVQVDGEPWVQSPSDVVVLKSALKATMLKKNKSKMKRRNTEPSMVLTGTAVPQMSLALPPSTVEADNESENSPNNIDF